jgi:dimethylargininase
MIALTHVPSPHMHAGIRTFVERMPIDHQLAMRQHVEFRRMLSRCGASVRTLDVNRELADCAFVEDAAVVLDEMAILTSMGAPDRRLELPAIAKELAEYRPVERIEPPAHLEGGDVLALGRTLLVGVSARTNRAGIEALDRIARPHGYKTVPVQVTGSLHLKTACTALDDETLVVNPKWIDVEALAGFSLVAVPKGEPWAANVLLIGGRIALSSAHLATIDLIQKRGLAVEPIDLSEFAKAEAGITCLCVLIGEAKS